MRSSSSTNIEDFKPAATREEARKNTRCSAGGQLPDA
jgi:hypothetical protein